MKTVLMTALGSGTSNIVVIICTEDVPETTGESVRDEDEEAEEQSWERERKERQERRQRELEEAKERELQELERLEKEEVLVLCAIHSSDVQVR